jgi:RND family efflux transporter MFP subunit
MNDDELDFGQTIRGFAEGQTVFDRFALRRVLGRGGMGVVWLAHDTRLDRNVALKFLPDLVRLDDGAVDDLKRETRRSLELTHPNIVRIYDFVLDDSSAAIAMEYIEGLTLTQMRLQKPSRVFEVEEIRAWARQALSALSYAHEVGKVVHRDLKPSNLMLTSGGSLKIADFGIARSLSDSVSRVSVRQPGATSGSPPYMSPQQIAGEISQVPDDIYSFGATLYELLTGKPPFFSGDIYRQVREVVPPSVSRRRSDLGVEGAPIDPTWEKAIAACLAKDPGERPQNALQLLNWMDGGEAAPREITSPPSSTRRDSPASINWWKRYGLVASGILGILLLAGLLIWWIGPLANDRSVPAQTEDAVTPSWPATIDGAQTASIEAKVKGTISTQNYKEGELVEKGRVLFTIDDHPFKTSLAQAEAQLAKSVAEVDAARAQHKTVAKLHRDGFISQQEFDRTDSAARAAEASVAEMQARVNSAKVDLANTRITAPFTGTVGRPFVRIGEEVRNSSEAKLAQMWPLDEVRAIFTVTESDYRRIMEHRSGEANVGSALQLKLADGSTYPETGRLDDSFEEDAKSGAIRVAGTFPNPQKLLRPGQQVVVTLTDEANAGSKPRGTNPAAPGETPVEQTSQQKPSTSKQEISLTSNVRGVAFRIFPDTEETRSAMEVLARNRNLFASHVISPEEFRTSSRKLASLAIAEGSAPGSVALDPGKYVVEFTEAGKIRQTTILSVGPNSPSSAAYDPLAGDWMSTTELDTAENLLKEAKNLQTTPVLALDKAELSRDLIGPTQEVLLTLTTLAGTSREPNKIRAYSEQILQGDPENFAARFNLAESFFVEKNYPKASELFREAAAVSPYASNRNTLWFRVYLSDLMTGKNPTAADYLAKAGESESSGMAEWIRAANIFHSGQNDAALSLVEDLKSKFTERRNSSYIDAFTEIGWLPLPANIPAADPAERTLASTELPPDPPKVGDEEISAEFTSTPDNGQTFLVIISTEKPEGRTNNPAFYKIGQRLAGTSWVVDSYRKKSTSTPLGIEQDASELTLRNAESGATIVLPLKTKTNLAPGSNHPEPRKTLPSDENSADSTKTPSPDGQVLTSNTAWRFFIINLGSKHGIDQGDSVQVWRGADLVCRGKITSVDAATSIADVAVDTSAMPKAGDIVRAVP